MTDSSYEVRYRASTGAAQPTTEIEVSLPPDVAITTTVIGTPGEWGAQVRIGAQLTLHVEDVSTVDRLGAAFRELVAELYAALAGTGEATP